MLHLSVSYVNSGVLFLIKGMWCSGITFASQAIGPGFNPRHIHFLKPIFLSTCVSLSGHIYFPLIIGIFISFISLSFSVMSSPPAKPLSKIQAYGHSEEFFDKHNQNWCGYCDFVVDDDDQERLIICEGYCGRMYHHYCVGAEPVGGKVHSKRVKIVQLHSKRVKLVQLHSKRVKIVQLHSKRVKLVQLHSKRVKFLQVATRTKLNRVLMSPGFVNIV